MYKKGKVVFPWSNDNDDKQLQNTHTEALDSHCLPLWLIYWKKQLYLKLNSHKMKGTWSWQILPSVSHLVRRRYCQISFRTYCSKINRRVQGNTTFPFLYIAACLFCFFQISGSIVYPLYCSDVEPGRKWSVLELPAQADSAGWTLQLSLSTSPDLAAILLPALVLCLYFRWTDCLGVSRAPNPFKSPL